MEGGDYWTEGDCWRTPNPEGETVGEMSVSMCVCVPRLQILHVQHKKKQFSTTVKKLASKKNTNKILRNSQEMESVAHDAQQEQATRRRFPMSFRKEVLNFHFSRRPPSVHATAKQFGIERKTVKGWMKKYSNITVMSESKIFEAFGIEK